MLDYLKKLFPAQTIDEVGVVSILGCLLHHCCYFISPLSILQLYYFDPFYLGYLQDHTQSSKLSKDSN